MLRPILLFIHVALVLPAGCSEESPTARETPDAIVHHLGDGAAALPDGPLAMADAAMVDAPIEPVAPRMEMLRGVTRLPIGEKP